MRQSFKVLILLLILFAFQQSLSQSSARFDTAAENKFTHAVEAFRSGKYFFAESEFENLIKLQTHQRTTASYLMLAKTYLHLSKPYESISILNRFIKSFPQSNYLDNAYYTIGLSYLEVENYFEAVGVFLRVLEKSKNKKTIEQASAQIEWIIVEKLITEQINDLNSVQTNPDTKIFIKILMSEKLFRSGEIKNARIILSEVLEKGQSVKYYNRALTLAEQMTKGLTLKLGVLTPLMKANPSSPFSEVGQDILNGIELAIDKFNGEFTGEINIVLDVRDTERSTNKAEREMQNLSTQRDVISVIGPVFSEEAQICGRSANFDKIPLITPTANADGIAAIGDYVFQINPDLQSKGKATANFAVKEKKIINLAVISSDEFSNKSIVKAFVDHAEKLGGNIVSVKYYNKETVNFSEIFQQLRNLAFKDAAEPVVSFSNRLTNLEKIKIIKAGADLKILDSLIETRANIGVNVLFGKNGKKIADSLGLKYTYQDGKPDELDYPASSIHGIFFLISAPDEIPIITAQLSYHNIKTKIIGTTEWYNINELLKSSLYIDEVFIISEIFVDKNNYSTSDFEIKYFNKFGKNYTRNSLFGYDAAQLVLSKIKNGSVTREKIRESLSVVKKYAGLKSKITLTKRRVNNEFNILQFREGKIVKVGEITVD